MASLNENAGEFFRIGYQARGKSALGQVAMDLTEKIHDMNLLKKRGEIESQNILLKSSLGAPKKKHLPVGQINAFHDTLKALDTLKEVKSKIQKYNFSTGPFSYRFREGEIGNLVMQTRGTKEEASFKAMVRRLEANFVKAESGVNRSYPELKYLRPSLPLADQDNFPNFVAKTDYAIQETQKHVERMLGVLQASGYETQDLRDLVGASFSGSEGGDFDADLLSAVNEELRRRQSP